MVTKEDQEYSKLDLIKELREYHKPVPERREGGITIKEYLTEQNISDKLATKQLNDFVEEGMLIREWAVLGPHARGWVYYRKGNTLNNQ